MTKISPYSSPRVRIAPSPTGPLHIGTARTALFNYLFAKKYGGSFILRIEDTDLERSEKKWEEDIMENLHWLGIEWDEGPIVYSEFQTKNKNQKERLQLPITHYKGNYGPYRQSERLESYAKYLNKLLKENKAYYCFCSPEELEAYRQEQMSRGEAPKYSGKCATLTEREVTKMLAEGKKSIIRFRTPARKVVFHDLIRGEIEFNTALLGDIAVAKDLTTPLYNFAAVIDDFEMRVTHVMRGEDHISNTPKQILLQEALDFPHPQYIHLPLILGPDRSKLSKSHGAIAIAEYRREGYLSEALVNFMAFLGWNPGTEKEIYTLEELIADFSLEQIQKSGAIFNMKRLNYINRVHIRKKSRRELKTLAMPYYPEKWRKDDDLVEKAVFLYRDRLEKLSDAPQLTDFFFQDVLQYDKELLRWKDLTDKEIAEILDALKKIFSKMDPQNFTKENIEKIVMSFAEGGGDRGKVLWPLRVALTGKAASAGPFEIAEVLGKEKVLKRLAEARSLCNQKGVVHG